MCAGKDDLTISFIGWMRQKQVIFAGCSKRPSSEAAGESKPEAYPQGYVKDFDESRTKLAGFFSSLLACETGRLPINHPHSSQDQRDAEDFARAHWFFQQHRGQNDGGHRSQIAKHGSA